MARVPPGPMAPGPGYCRGTRVLTDLGEVAVEDLCIGDGLVTMSGIAQPLRRLGRHCHGGPPVRIGKGALAEGVPMRDLLVSPLQAITLDGMPIPALALVNGVSITRPEREEQVEYFQIELVSHDVIHAEGVLAESFIGDDDRRVADTLADQADTLEALRLSIVTRAEQPRKTEHPPRRRGNLDLVNRYRIEGWAQDPAAPDAAVTLLVLDNGVVIRQVLADRYRADLHDAGVGDGRHGFEITLPDGLPQHLGHVIEVRPLPDGLTPGSPEGEGLPGSPWIIEAEAGSVVLKAGSSLNRAPKPTTGTAWRGQLDLVSRDHIAGWAYDERRPEQPMALHLLDHGEVIASLLANRYRGDLHRAGFGDGRHGFDLQIAGGLSPLVRHVITMQPQEGGFKLHPSPVVIEPSQSFDAALEQAVSNAVASLGSASEQERVLHFLVAQADRLLQSRAEVTGQRQERLAFRQFRRRWGADAGAFDDAISDPGLRALVVDDVLPDPTRDAGSQAVLSHMHALRRLGYAVSFAAADEQAGATLPPELAPIICCRAPFYASIEDVMRRQMHCFDVIYLHRVSTASRYLALARRYNPQARILYNVADLHHLRIKGQAEIEQRPELFAVGRRLRLEECTAAWSADAVLTHSLDEARLLQAAVPEAKVHVAPWSIQPRPVTTPFAQRRGVAFIGGFAHAPNVDAACFLAEEVMPLVWRADPSIECLLVGSQMPAAVRDLAGPRLLALGHVPDLCDVFERVRLTVAPLRYGAGVKGKVLASVAAGVPCVMSRIAAEGIALPPPLQELVGADAAALAALIVERHADEEAAEAVRTAGLAWIDEGFNDEIVAAAIRAAIDGRPLARMQAQIQRLATG